MKNKRISLLLGVAAFAMFGRFGYTGLLVVMFLMGTQSAFFGPAKYGVLPELVGHDRLVRANSWIEGSTILAIVLGIGVPAFQNVVATNRMAAAVNELVASIHLARSEAVKRRSNTTLCASTDGAGCDPAAGLRDGWIVD